MNSQTVAERNCKQESRNQLLEVRDLRVEFSNNFGTVKAVNGVSFHVDRQEIVSIVGESGCGKSVTQMSVLQLIKCPPGKIVNGEVWFDGENLLLHGANSRQMRSIRGSRIAMIFQEPMTSLNPVYTIEYQMTELIRTHLKMSKAEIREYAVELLHKVGIPAPRQRIKEYPFQMSGGMRQRVMIAMAISCHPDLIIADEPTTALDVTTQAQVMELMTSLVKEMGVSLIVVTHNLGLVACYSDRTYVMYAGNIVESGTTRDILMNPKHPYTEGLLKSIPRLDSDRNERLIPIIGGPPSLLNLPNNCVFCPRCSNSIEICRTMERPKLKLIGPNKHYTACHNCLENKKEGGA